MKGIPILFIFGIFGLSITVQNILADDDVDNNMISSDASQLPVVELLNFHDRKYSGAKPMDLSSDGKSLLIQYDEYNTTAKSTFFFLALADSNLQNVTDLPISQSDQQKQFPIFRALFSPLWNSDDKTIYVLQNGQLYGYDLRNKSVKELKDNVAYFDILPDGKNLIYNTYDYRANSDHIETLSIDTGNSQKILDNLSNVFSFDLSPNGKDLLYVQTVSGKGQVLTYYDLETKQQHEVPNVALGYFDVIPTWVPSGSFIAYHVKDGDPKSWAGGMLSITSLGGEKSILIPSSRDNPNAVVFGNDGKSMIVSIDHVDNGSLSSKGKADMYKIVFAKPIPEFSSISSLVLIISLISVVVFGTSIRKNL